MEIKNNQQMNNLVNMRQPQEIIKKTHQHHNNTNINIQQNKVNQREQHRHPENKLSHQLHLQRSILLPTRDNSSMSLIKKENIENNYSNRITQQKIKTCQFINSTDTSSMEPKTNFLIKKREIIKNPNNDNDKDVTSIKVSSDKKSNTIPSHVSLNNIEKLNIMSTVTTTARSTFEQPHCKSYDIKEEQYPNEESYEINTTDQGTYF